MAIHYNTRESGEYEAVSITGNDIEGFKIVNKPLVEVKGTKTWDDADNQDGSRPESITVKLLADGEETDSVEVTEEDEWKFSFSDLPKYKDGIEIEYTIEEKPVEGYETELEGDPEKGFSIINTHKPNKPEEAEINIAVTKKWEDNNNKEGSRPEKIKVMLFADGENTGKFITITEDEEGIWAGAFTGLKEGPTYTVEEEPVSGYEAVYEGDQEKGFTITNKPEEKGDKPKEDEKKPEKEDKKKELKPENLPKNKETKTAPKTGDDMNPYGYILLLAAAGAAAVAFLRKRIR